MQSVGNHDFLTAMTARSVHYQNNLLVRSRSHRLRELLERLIIQCRFPAGKQ